MASSDLGQNIAAPISLTASILSLFCQKVTAQDSGLRQKIYYAILRTIHRQEL